jgi:ZIP family zinc transporter
MNPLLLATLAGLCTGIGSVIAIFVQNIKRVHLALILGFSAGVMIYISFAELLPQSIADIGKLQANIALFIGFLLIAVLDLLIPHQYKAEQINDNNPLTANINRIGEGTGPAKRIKSIHNLALLRVGIFTAIGIAIHNMPEGLVVFAGASSGNENLGFLVAIAIALHNIPEGVTVSVPIKQATGNSKMAFILSFASGLAEPLGAVVGYLVLSPFLTTSLIGALLAFAAGIMLYISLDELIPAALEYGASHWVILGVGSGMLVMAASSVVLI